MFKKVFIISLALIASSCSPTISNFNSYLPQQLPKTDYMPSSDVAEGKSPKVVVFELDEGANKTATQADLGKSMTVAVENVLTENHLAELVDRTAATKLEKEIALAEMNKTGSYQGPVIADYAVSGSIGNAGFTKKYSSGYTIPLPQKFGGGTTQTAPKYNYSSDVSGNIKIYALPSMQVVENFAFTGKKSRSEEVKTDNNLAIGGLVHFSGQKAAGLDRDDDLVRSAGVEAIDNISFDLKNFFAKKGFILEKRALKNKVIFKISAGSENGIMAGDKFEVIGQYKSDNALTGKSNIERRTIASGKVSDRIDTNFAWVLIDDSNSVNQIRLGDMVQFKYQRSFFDQTSKELNNLIN